MKIFTHTGATSKEGVILETPAQKLLVSYKPAGAAGAAALAEFRAVKLEANIVNALNGTEPLIYTMKLADLMEIAASNEGFVKEKSDKTVVGTVELSNVGALDLGQDQISLTFTGMDAAGVLEVSTIDSPELTKSYIKYSPVNFQADAPKELNVEDYYQIALPRATIVKVELKYPNGRNISYVPTELETICDEVNELSYLVPGAAAGQYQIIPGSRDWFCLGVSDAITAKITLSASGNVYFVKNDNLI
jgi:hypothetical protein